MSGSLGSATDLLEWAVLSHTLGIAPFTMPSALFISLCTSVPTDTTQGTEVAGGGYFRQPATFVMQQPTPSNVAMNAATLEWPVATAPWGVIGWWEIWSAPTVGVRYYWGTLVDPADGVTPITRTVGLGDILRIAAGALVVTAD